MKANDTIKHLTRCIIGMINTRANVIAFTETINRYKLKYNKQSALYNQAVYVVTLDRLMDTYEKETK